MWVDRFNGAGCVCTCGTAATRATICYRAGIDCDACVTDPRRALAQLATGLLPAVCHPCCAGNTYFKEWTADVAKRDEQGQPRIDSTFNDLNNAWGTTKGSILAYKFFDSVRVGRGVVI